MTSQTKDYKTKLSKLRGQLKKIIFQSDDSPFGIASIKVLADDDPVIDADDIFSAIDLIVKDTFLDEEQIITGDIGGITSGLMYTFWGEKTTHPKHGKQLKVLFWEMDDPTTIAGLYRMLDSAEYSAEISYRFSDLLIKHFGLELLPLLDNEPDKIREYIQEYIKESQDIDNYVQQAEQLISTRCFRKQYAFTLAYLNHLGIESDMGTTIIDEWKNETLDKINENPYSLIDFWVDYKICDNIAASIDFPNLNGEREYAGLNHYLHVHCYDEGHTLCSFPKLIGKLPQNLKNNMPKIEAAFQKLREDKKIKAYACGGTWLLQGERFAKQEANLAKKLSLIMNTPLEIDQKLVNDYMKSVDDEGAIKLEGTQRQALIKMITEKTFILTGLPGSGKTTITQFAIQFFHKHNINFKLASPTGKAAKRLEEVAGFEAKTIHRLLEYHPETGGFLHNKDYPLSCDVLLLDEVSMVDLSLMKSLIDALRPETRLILVGDKNQLPSIGPGSILRDLLSYGIPQVSLTHIFRQGKVSLIKENAHKIISGDPLLLLEGDVEEDMVFVPTEDTYGFYEALYGLLQKHPHYSIQVLCPTRKNTLGANNLNRFLQYHMNASPEVIPFYNGQVFRVGDRVMHTKNNYKLNVFNGDMGVIDSFKYSDKDPGEPMYFDCPPPDMTPEQSFFYFNQEESTLPEQLKKIWRSLRVEGMYVQYPEELIFYDFKNMSQLTLAYAMSVHKSQGSEYPVVIMPMSVKDHRPNLYKRLFYTACTRARKKLYLLGEPEAVEIARKDNRNRERDTYLPTWMTFYQQKETTNA